MTESLPPIAEAEPVRREATGWIFLACIFGLLVFMALAGQSPDASKSVRLAEAEPILRGAVTRFNSPAPSEQREARRSIADLESQITPARFTDPTSAEIYAAAQTLINGKIGKSELKLIAASKDPLDRNAAAIYSRPTLSRGDAARLGAGLEKRGFLGQLMRAQAYAKAGDRGPLTSLTSSSSTGQVLGAVLVFAVGAVSLVAWIHVGREWSSGRLRPKGLPVRLPSLLDADRLALRAAALISLYLLLSLVPQVLDVAFKIRLDDRVSELMVGAAMLVAVPLLFRKPVSGRIFRLADIGVTGKNFPANLKLGLIGFGIEFPIAMILAVVGQALFSGIHASHPATVALETSHDWLTILAIFSLASLVAPFWEEIMFRGLLFPAFSKLTGKVLYGAIISSFLFGAVHPQGLPALIALMSLACVSCALTYYTNSLVPSMVLHAAHNTTLLALTLLYS